MTQYYPNYVFDVHYDGPSFLVGLLPLVVIICLAISIEEWVHNTISFLSNRDRLAMMRLIASIIMTALLGIFCIGIAVTFYYDVYLHKLTPQITRIILNTLFFLLYTSISILVIYILMVLWNKEQRHRIGAGGLRGLILGILLVLGCRFTGVQHYDNILLVILITGMGFLWGVLGRREFLLQKWVLLLYPVEQGVIISLFFSIFVIWIFKALYGINFENARAISFIGLWLSLISVALTSMYTSRLIRTEPFETSPYKKQRYFKIGILIFFFFWIGEVYSIMTVSIE